MNSCAVPCRRAWWTWILMLAEHRCWRWYCSVFLSITLHAPSSKITMKYDAMISLIRIRIPFLYGRMCTGSIVQWINNDGWKKEKWFFSLRTILKRGVHSVRAHIITVMPMLLRLMLMLSVLATAAHTNTEIIVFKECGVEKKPIVHFNSFKVQ